MREGSNWSRTEVEAAVASYREMLQLELAGASFNKKQRNADLQKVIGRNAGSIEFKHQNISAILNNAGVPYIIGYKPRGNYQGLLEEVVVEQVIENTAINSLASEVVARHEFFSNPNGDILAIKVAPPTGLAENVGYSDRVAVECPHSLIQPL